ncbi:hypothetical protein ABEB36_002137 [Hypothenemus hampei]|uniref:non-specific serine/threonine protein kinase n=1 Tax=Hypothenemus hampei TaxID=57062 RepID=A0ABD1F4N5_HYPHA
MSQVVNSLFANLENSSSPEEENPNQNPNDSECLTVALKNEQRSTRVSLLVEALVRSLVSVYQPDGKKATQFYKKICRRLFNMGLIDESWSMTELEGARIQFEQALGHLFREVPVSSPSSPLQLSNSYYSSQYLREFEEVKKIGGGGFGKVFQVKHRLDGLEYAVKKISIRSESIDSVKNYLSEVKTFASLNHPNIVQYKAAWLELDAPSKVNHFSFEPLENDSLASDIDTHSDCTFSKHLTGERVVLNEFEDPIDLPHVGFSFTPKISSMNSLMYHKDSNNSFEIAFQNSLQQESTNENCVEEESSYNKAVVALHPNSTKPKVLWATLYIQMTLCHGTLDQWLQSRNAISNKKLPVPANTQSIRTKAIQQIVIQVLQGLKYIHSKGIVHHDIKPSNIFVSTESGSLLVQLGDFGLACPLQRSRHVFARGTPLYAAPEQLAGFCNPKSDMYSLGLVLYELQEDFATDMERVKKLSQLRSKSDPPIPTELSMSNLVSALVRRRSAERPEAFKLLEVLENILGDTSKTNVKILEKQLEEKDKEIERLRELLLAHGIRDG